jgi:GNAT superfamily N-acetyltransferase
MNASNHSKVCFMSVSIRLLGNADLESADAILKSAFRPSGNWIDGLRLCRRIQPDGWFLALPHGSPAGMVGTVNYGPYAYVGLMAVHQEFQRQGIGLSLMQYLLATLPERAFMVRDNRGRVTGFIFAQRNRIGPWVAQCPQDVETLLRAALSLTYDGAVSVVAPEMNREGTALLKRYGFEIIRTTRHMGRGQSAPPLDRSKVYGLTSLALG